MISGLLEDIGVPEEFIPCPYPFVPIPRVLAMKMEGLDRWKVYTLRGTIVEMKGHVYAKDKEEAEEAAENKFGERLPTAVIRG